MTPPSRIIALAAGLLALSMVAGGRLASAQEKPGTANIAVVDMQFLMQHSAAAKNARAQVEKFRAVLQQVIKGQLQGIKKDYEKIAKERSALSKDAYEQRLLGLRKKAASYQNDAEKRQAKLDDSLNEALGKIISAIGRNVDQIIKERKFTLVLSRSATIGTFGVPNITEEVLKRLDQQISSVSVDLPK